tara:strand:+ start:6370 stop:6489 length:120 start_codon:yes stop_codon:yes gene_type:complete
MNIDPITRQWLVTLAKEAAGFLIISGLVVFCAWQAVLTL